MKTINIVCFVLVGVFVIAMFNIHNIYAIFWKAENATVTLSGCSTNCELKGTLSVMPFDGRHVIDTDNGRVVLAEGSYTLITYPNEKVD